MNDGEPDTTSRGQDPDRSADPRVAEEESAAAAEAARIGGVVPPASDDPALEPLYEAGEGEEEGFELAEAELIENAQHGERHGDPEIDAFTPEREADRSTAAYGEADELESTELDEDANPGQG